MRIAMVGPFGFHPNKTMRSRAFQLARQLVQRGHTVRLLMPPWQTPEEAGRSWEEDGVELRYTPLRGGRAGTAVSLIRETLAWKPQIVHTFKPKAYSGLTAWWVWQFKRRQIRLVTDTDDWEGWGGWNDIAPYSPMEKRFFAWQERWGMRHCHALTVASRELDRMAQASGVPPERVHYLPNGPGIGDRTEQAAARRTELGLAERPTLLLYSRLFEFDTTRLLAVLKRVKKAIPSFRLLIVGASLYQDDSIRFQEQLQDTGLAAHIIEVGWLEETAVPNTLAAADVGLYLMNDTLLNRTKCPVKLADMVYIGLPIVAEGVGQVTEYVKDGQTGVVCAVGDVEGVSTAVIHLLQDKAEQQQFSAAARAHMRASFTWEKTVATLEGVYQMITSSFPTADLPL
jgi:glycosyltransferase involved in cell wall biosynthesis